MTPVETLVMSIFSSVIIALLIAMFVNQRRQIDQIRQEMAALRAEFRAEIAAVRTEIAAVRTEIAAVRTEVAELRRSLSAVEKDTAMLVGRLLPEDEVLARITNRPQPVS